MGDVIGERETTGELIYAQENEGFRAVDDHGLADLKRVGGTRSTVSSERGRLGSRTLGNRGQHSVEKCW